MQEDKIPKGLWEIYNQTKYMHKLYKHGEIRFNVEEKNTQTEDVGS